MRSLPSHRLPRPVRLTGGRPEWVGGQITLPMYITEGEPYRPEAMIWLELPSRLIVSWTLLDPAAQRPSFADTLREAMRGPQAGPPRRPVRVRVADEMLAAEARAALADAPGEATEVVVAPTPELDELVRLFAESLPRGDETATYLERGRLRPGAIEQLFRAAEALYLGAPWTHAHDEPAESYTGETELTVRLTAPYEAVDLFADGLEGNGPAQLGLPAFARDESAGLGPGWFSVPFELTGPGLPSVPDAPPGVRAAPPARAGRHIGRNDPCPCGSGKKYKRCHLGAHASESGGTAPDGPTAPSETAALHELDRRLVDVMAGYARERFGDEWLRFELDFADAEATSQLSLHWALYHLRIRGRSVAGHFLAKRGDGLSGEERAWLDAQSRSWLSIWEVQSARPGESLDLEDLLTGERRHVVEASGSRMLVPRTAVLARIVDHGGLSLICGSHPQPLPPLEAADIASAYRRRLRRGSTSPIERLREERVGRDLIADWEDAIAGLEERSRIPPRMRNTDGDELVFVTDRFDLDPAARAEVEARLAAMPGVIAPEEGDADRDYVFHRDGPTRPSQEDLIVGHATVGERALTLETNSLRRADALRRRVEAALGALVHHRRRGRRDAQRMAERAWEQRVTGREPRDRGAHGDGRGRDAGREAGAHGDLADLPEAQQMIREMKERHYADWADQPLPALGGRSARQAVRSARGRERVDALLKSIEHGEATLPPGERFDVSPLRRSLGL